MGVTKYSYLINKFKTNKNIFNAKKEELIQVKYISDKIVQEILNREIRKLAKLHLQFMEKNQIDIISIAVIVSLSIS